MEETILIVDDEKNYHPTLTALFRHEGYKTLSAYSGNEAWNIIRGNHVDLVLSDMTMPDGNGFELLARVKEHYPEIPVIMLTAFGTVELAVEAMKLGAVDYLTKPCPIEEMLKVVAKALEESRSRRSTLKKSHLSENRSSFGRLIGQSMPMRELYHVMEKVAPTKANVLITGESGTGKELVAQAIHSHSTRSKGPFVAVNCSALSPSLLESELFGHEKGAFTDARQSRAGRFEMAGGGTLFLDEIGELDHSIQVKLLRVLQERKFERVGGGTSLSMDVRLIAATNRNLKEEVKNGSFREDLYFRLNVVHLHLPALRERLDDLPILVEHFLHKYSEGRKVSLSHDAMRLMYAYWWPGNVRELENVIERGLVLSTDDEISAADLPDEIRHSSAFELHEANLTIAPPREVLGQSGDNYREALRAGRNADDESSVSEAWLKQVYSVFPPDIYLNDAVGTLEEAILRRAMAENAFVQAQAAASLGLNKTGFKYKWDKYVTAEPNPLAAVLAEIIPSGVQLTEALDGFEEFLIKTALNKTSGVQSQAADLLGIKKNLIGYKLKKFNINPKDLSKLLDFR